MAYIVNVTETPPNVAATYAVTLGAHVTDDLLLICLSQDGGGTAITAPGGWTMIGTQAASQACRQAWAYKVATSGAEANPTFSGSNDDWIGTCFVIRDADPTTPINGWQRSDWGNSSTISTGDSNAVAASSAGGTTVITAAADALLMYSWNCDGVSVWMRCPTNDLIADSKVASSTDNSSHIIGHRQHGASGTVPSVTMYCVKATEGGNGWVLAIANKTNGIREKDCRSGITEFNWYGNFGATHQAVTWQPPSNFAATINGITCDASGASTAIATTNAEALTPWGNPTEFNCTLSTASTWVGGTHTLSATDMTGKVFALQWAQSLLSTAAPAGVEGVIVGFSDGTNWVAYQLSPKSLFNASVVQQAFIALGAGAAYASSGSVNWASITRMGFFQHRAGSSTNAGVLRIKNAMLMEGTASSPTPAVLTGGGNGRAVDFITLFDALNSWGSISLANKQGSAQILAKACVQLGDGTKPTYFDSSASSFEYPLAFSGLDYVRKDWNVPAGNVSLRVKASASDTINLTAGVLATATQQALTIDSSSSTSASYSFAGTSIVGWLPTWKTGAPCNGVTFKSCGIIDGKGAVFDTCTFTGSKSVTSAVKLTAGGGLLGCTLTKGAETYAVELAEAGSYDLTDTVFTGYTTELTVTATTGTVTITLATGQTVPDYTISGATVVFVQPTVDVGFAPLVSGSQVVVYAQGTTTELFRTNSSGTSATWAEAAGAYDYTVQKAGYLPVRGSGAAPAASLTIDPQQKIDRAYTTSSGLGIGTNCTANTGTLKFGLTTASTLQNFYSYMIEQWISNSALRNIDFPLAPNGPNSFRFIDWTWDGQTSINYLSRDGMQYYSGGAATDIWAALLSVGVPAGFQVRYQQQDGLGTTNALTTGNIDQLVKIYQAGGGGFDYRNWLVLKVQAGGYDQAEAVAQDIYGTLEDQLYVFGLTPIPNGIAAGSVDATVTVTPEPTPVLWNGSYFSTTIKDTTNTHSGLQIMQAVRAENQFNWSDLVRPNGDKFKTVTGNFYGDAYTTPAGVRVVKADGVTPHPDFNLFNDDTGGSPYVPPITAPITWAGALSGTTVLLYNDSNAGAIIDTQVVSGGGGYVWSIALPHADVAAGDSLRLRFGNKEYYAGELQGTMTASGLAFVGAMTLHPIYAGWGLDGSVYDQANGGPFTMDGVNLEIDIGGGAGSGLKKALGAWTQHLMTLPAGLDAFYRAWDLLDLNLIRQNVGVIDVLIDKPTAGQYVFTDNDVNYYRSDFSIPYNTTHSTIFMTYNAKPFVATVTGANVITGDAADILAAIPSASSNAAATLAAAQITPIYADAKKMNGATIVGNGTEGNLWRGQ